MRFAGYSVFFALHSTLDNDFVLPLGLKEGQNIFSTWASLPALSTDPNHDLEVHHIIVQ